MAAGARVRMRAARCRGRLRQLRHGNPRRDGSGSGGRGGRQRLPRLRRRRGRARTPAGPAPLHPLFRSASAAAVGQTGLALPGPGLSENDVYRGASAGRAAGETDRSCSELGNRCTPAFRHFGLDPGPPTQRLLAHRLARIRAEAARRIGAAARLKGVDALGVDEHVWAHTGPPGTGMVTGIVDHTRDTNDTVHARLLDLVPGRSRKAYADWLKDPGPGFTAGIRTARPGSVPRLRQRHPRRAPREVCTTDVIHSLKGLCSCQLDQPIPMNSKPMPWIL